MKRIGFITYRQLSRLTQDDALAVEALREAGVGVHPLIWDDESVPWGDYDALVLRSCWDYHRRPRGFAAWLRKLQSAGTSVWNPAELVHWNMDKAYLGDLEKRGVRIPRTVYIPGGEAADLAGALQDAGLTEAVLKPTVSATAWQTIRTSTRAAAADQGQLDTILRRSGAMLQEYVPEIAEVGEWSLIFLGGRFSHGVLKVPLPGEFRVQADFGGGVENQAPPPGLVEQAAAVLKEVETLTGHSLLYARVDGVERQGKLILMELEAIEPELFFRADPSAPGRFAAAVQATCLTEQG